MQESSGREGYHELSLEPIRATTLACITFVRQQLFVFLLHINVTRTRRKGVSQARFCCYNACVRGNVLSLRTPLTASRYLLSNFHRQISVQYLDYITAKTPYIHRRTLGSAGIFYHKRYRWLCAYAYLLLRSWWRWKRNISLLILRTLEEEDDDDDDRYAPHMPRHFSP